MQEAEAERTKDIGSEVRGQNQFHSFLWVWEEEENMAADVLDFQFSGHFLLRFMNRDLPLEL